VTYVQSLSSGLLSKSIDAIVCPGVEEIQVTRKIRILALISFPPARSLGMLLTILHQQGAGPSDCRETISPLAMPLPQCPFLWLPLTTTSSSYPSCTTTCSLAGVKMGSLVCALSHKARPVHICELLPTLASS
jgi:hypothetical protein